ncbi:MAG: D-cysteine desulfhydrase [Candidatus Azotimanducaceae bacterium]|jgi:D-cysteine desulfhydrase
MIKEQLPPRISLARLPTPLVKLERLSQAIGGPEIWLKRDDLTDTTASGNKLRKLEFSVAQALADGATRLITAGGIQSNHCRATAVIARQLGLGCHLLLRGREPEEADGNLFIDQLLGTTISYLGQSEFDDLDQQVEKLAEHYAAQGEKSFYIPIGASDEIGLWGYIEASKELREDFVEHNISPEYVVSAAGSGGTLGGLIIGRERYRLDAKPVAFNVSNDADFFREKISQDCNTWQQRYSQKLEVKSSMIDVIDGYVGPGYARADPIIFDTIKHLARLEGVILDPVYTGKAFYGMLQEIESGRFQDSKCLVFLHTGGIYGLFPQKALF